jgi:hypothetical protein
MQDRDAQVPRHESVAHDDPTDAGLMEDEEVPGTGIMGDETVVRPAPDVEQPGIAPGTVNDAEDSDDGERSPPPPPS